MQSFDDGRSHDFVPWKNRDAAADSMRGVLHATPPSRTRTARQIRELVLFVNFIFKKKLNTSTGSHEMRILTQQFSV